MKKIMKLKMQKALSSMTFPQALVLSKKINEVCDLTNQHLQTFPKCAMGLTPDAVKNSREFIDAKWDFDVSFENLRNFNKYYTKQFKHELLKMRDEKRAAQIAKNSELVATA